jgi:hypothetical protein
MATSKTGSFWLTEQVTITSGTPVQGTIDLGSYVDVGDQQALSVEQVDYIFQRVSGGEYSGMLTAIGAEPFFVDVQLSDVNPGTDIGSADSNNLVSSGTLMQGADSQSYHGDLYPDNFGKGDASRIVVNDQMYFVGETNNDFSGTGNLLVTCRIKARIVKLNTKDWMAIAIQSTAADN